VLQQLLAHQEDVPRPVSDFRADVPPELARLLERLLAKDPARRFQTPGDLLAALEPFARRAVPTGAPGRPGPGKRGRRLAAGVALLLLAALGGWYFTTGRDDPVRPGPRPVEKPASWAERPSARDQVLAWVTKNNTIGPAHPMIADLARAMDRDLKGHQAFLAQLGVLLVRSGKPTLLAGRHHDLFVFEFAPNQVGEWVRPAHFRFRVVGRPSRGVHPHPLVRLADLRIERGQALNLRSRLAGSVAYRKLQAFSGTVCLRCTYALVQSDYTVFSTVKAGVLAPEGRLKFSYPPVGQEGAIPRWPLVVFLDVGLLPGTGDINQMVLISNTVAAPVFVHP
jgi:hypothetical protein